ncbi:MAG TPA: hypothetical protein VGB79_06620 [Allosphingosinicella sp.]|jgi:hypothetical protein
MSVTTVHFYKGTTADDTITLDIDTTTVLSAVRAQLVQNGFVAADTPTMALRFVAESATSTNLQDALIVPSVENLVPLSGVLGPANQVILTNINATTRPDLIGIGTTTFFNQHLGVQVFLNNSDPQGQATNSQIGAFDPLMLTNVKPTSQNVTGIYDNVCVCVEGSVVGFSIRSWGAVGFQMYIAPAEGDPIVNDDLFLPFGPTPNQYSSTDILRYSTRSQTIQIVGADTAGVSPSQTIRFQKVTFRTRRMTQYSQNGTTYSSQQMPPIPTVTQPGGLDGSIQAMGIQRQLIQANGIETVPGGSIKPGGPIEGPPSNQNWGGPISDIVTDDPSQPMGEIVVYFFVFKTHADAMTVINGYNAPNPALWS